jgi:hypothetical protein
MTKKYRLFYPHFQKCQTQANQKYKHKTEMGNKIAKFASSRSQNDRCSISLKRKRSTDIDSSDEEQEMHTAKRYMKRK